jgi:amidase
LISGSDTAEQLPVSMPAPVQVSKGTVHHTLSAAHAPTASVEPGARVRVETELNIGDHIRELGDTFDLSMAAAPFLNGVTGPIEVNGATCAHVLVCDIEQMELVPPGFTAIAPGLWPFLDHDHGAPPAHKVVDVRDGHVIWDEQIRIPVRPMVGVLGTAPALEAISTMDCGPHGGNLDVQELGPGARVYLPVAVNGALLFVGDCHAVQGDGELCGFGATEIRSQVTIQIDIAPRPTEMCWPRFENSSHIGAIACGRPLEDAFRLAARELVQWLSEDFGFGPADAMLLLGQVAEARCTQLVNPHYTYVCKIDKRYLPRGAANDL